jgi:hypothetical protein
MFDIETSYPERIGISSISYSKEFASSQLGKPLVEKLIEIGFTEKRANSIVSRAFQADSDCVSVVETLCKVYFDELRMDFNEHNY